GFVVEPQGVEAPQRERRIAHPAVPVVPVALAARRLRQRRRRRGNERPRRLKVEAAEYERRALQVPAPWMIGEGTARQPLAPGMRGRVHVTLSLLNGPRPAERLGPRQRAEDALALDEPMPGVRAVALD